MKVYCVSISHTHWTDFPVWNIKFVPDHNACVYTFTNVIHSGHSTYAGLYLVSWSTLLMLYVTTIITAHFSFVHLSLLKWVVIPPWFRHWCQSFSPLSAPCSAEYCYFERLSVPLFEPNVRCTTNEPCIARPLCMYILTFQPKNNFFLLKPP